MYKLFSGVNHLHSKNVVHRDLKPENFLFTKASKKSEIKIIDFGLSAKFDADFNRLNSVVGTPYFVAPEVLAGSYSKECDVWSLGVIMYILLSGEPPFNGANPKEVFRKVMKVDFNFELAVWQDISNEAKDLIRSILVKNPLHRPTILHVMDHPWFKFTRTTKAKRNTLLVKTLTNLVSYKAQKRLRSEAMKILIKFVSSENIDDLKEIFEQLDTGHTGSITPLQLEHAMREIGLDIAGDEVSQILNQVDYLSQGKIHYSDFLLATLDAKSRLSEQVLFETFQHFDHENKGFITTDNLTFAFKMAGIELEPEEIVDMQGSYNLTSSMTLTFDQFKRILLDPEEQKKKSVVYRRRVDRLSSSIIDPASRFIQPNNESL